MPRRCTASPVWCLAQALVLELLRLSDRVPLVRPRAASQVRGRPLRLPLPQDYRGARGARREQPALDLDEEFREKSPRRALLHPLRPHRPMARRFHPFPGRRRRRRLHPAHAREHPGRRRRQAAHRRSGDVRTIPRPSRRAVDPLLRERVVIAYHRHGGASDIPNIDDVIALCRRTGDRCKPETRPKGYPRNIRIQRLPRHS